MNLSTPSRWLLLATTVILLILSTVSSVVAQGPTNPAKAAYVEPARIPQDPTAPVVPDPLSIQIASAEPGFAAVIPNDGYIGTLDGNDAFGADAGMACMDINTSPYLPATAVVHKVTVRASITHTWVGDLTIKVRNPSGTIITLQNRAGSNAPDDGVDTPVGDSSNWNGSLILYSDGAGPEAELMGSSLTDGQNICADDGVCAHDPTPDTATQPPSKLGDLRGLAATGIWTMCVGDASPLDSGTFDQFKMSLSAADVYTSTLNPLTIPDDGYTGGFGGAGQACVKISTASSPPGSATVLDATIRARVTHTSVGDLTMKLRSPNNTTLTVLNRPGSSAPDNGTGGAGYSANWSNSSILFGDVGVPEAETMGVSLTTNQSVCIDNAVCAHNPSPDTATQPPTSFNNFDGSTALGNWQLCMGDSMPGEVGTLNKWTLYLARPPLSLATNLAAFGATATADGVKVIWETATETGNLGFNLYRSTAPALTGELLTPELIASTAPGNGQGSVYEFTDTTAAPGIAYYYSLQDVDLNGTSVMHPAVSVPTGQPTAVEVGDMGSIANTSYGDFLPLAAGLALLSMVGLLLRQRRSR